MATRAMRCMMGASTFLKLCPEGTYDFRVAMLDPRSGKPAVRFAIAGRDADGWYSEGQIQVSKRPQ